jgi:hypothetical protein
MSISVRRGLFLLRANVFNWKVLVADLLTSGGFIFICLKLDMSGLSFVRR